MSNSKLTGVKCLACGGTYQRHEAYSKECFDAITAELSALKAIVEVTELTPEEGGGYYATLPIFGDYMYRGAGDTAAEAIAELAKTAKAIRAVSSLFLPSLHPSSIVEYGPEQDEDERLSASQAREARLREALEYYVHNCCPHSKHNECPQNGECAYGEVAAQALADAPAPVEDKREVRNAGS